MNKKTSLYNCHLSLNAKMAPFAGWDMPLQYSSAKDEALSVRKEMGVFDVSHMGEFLVAGKDATKLVDYCITNDLMSLPSGKAIYSPLCAENGGILDDLICYKFNEEKILICVNAANIEQDFNWFQKHATDFECQLEDISNSFSLLAIQGPQAVSYISKKLNLSEIKPFNFIEHNGWYIARTGYTGEDGFELFIPNNQVVTFWNELMNDGVKPCGLVARDILRTEAGFPLYGQELTQEVSPLESGLKWTVKLKKDNFIGKTAIEKRSNLYKNIKLILDKGIPRQGYDILQKEKIGTVTSGTMSPTIGKGIAICRISIDEFDENEEIYVQIRNRLFPAKTTKSFLNKN